MDSLIILKLLPLSLFIDSTHGAGEGFPWTFSLIPRWVFPQIPGLKPLSEVRRCRMSLGFMAEGLIPLVWEVFVPQRTGSVCRLPAPSARQLRVNSGLGLETKIALDI